MSSSAAAGLLSDALGLRHRLPRVWARVLAGEARVWRACRIAHASAALSLKAAGFVDAAVEKIINRVGPDRLKKIVDTAMWEADPERAQAQAEQQARSQGVWAGRSDEFGMNTLFVRATSGEVIRVQATIQALAEALRVLGDTDSLDRRRAKAIGWLADPVAAIRLLHAARYLATKQSRPADEACSTTTMRPTTMRPTTMRPTTMRPTSGATPAAAANAQEERREGAGWQLAADGWDQSYVPDGDQRGLEEPPPPDEPPPPGELSPPDDLLSAALWPADGGAGVDRASDGAGGEELWDSDEFRWGSLSARLAEIKDRARRDESARGTAGGVGTALCVHITADMLTALAAANGAGDGEPGGYGDKGGDRGGGVMRGAPGGLPARWTSIMSCRMTMAGRRGRPLPRTWRRAAGTTID